MVMLRMVVFCMIMRGMIVRVVMMRVIVAGMVVACVAMPRVGIGAAFRIERRLDLDDARAETFYHCLDHVVAPDPQTPRHDLGWQMAVAEMPGHPDQMQWV